jgi:TPR repeat protein
MLLQRGGELFGTGDISAARLVFHRAATSGSAKAMTALGATYDSAFFGKGRTIGIRPDPAIAADWYRKAAAIGDTEAAARLKRLETLLSPE